MTGHIISLHGDLHDDACALLPWYVTGRLEAEDVARVEAHLAICPQCQADLAGERRLHAAVAELDEPIGNADAGFAALRGRLTPQPEAVGALPVQRRVEGFSRQWRQSAPWLRWAVAAELALLVLAGAAFAVSHKASAPQYRTLGAAPEPAAANIVVVFRPDVRESDMRRTLRDTQARMVDGPTAADAYLLHVAPAGRTEAVARLRHDATIVLAEPIDGGEKP
jgi:anti-sigma factor RsiW